MKSNRNMDGLSLLRKVFTKWRLSLLVLLVIYALLVTINLGYMSIQWDEMPHLNGGLLLAHGQGLQYMQTYGYYPPIYDLLTTASFRMLGASATSGRLVAVAFSLLSILVVFEIANRTYGPKVALIASVLLGSMPGFVWVSHVSLLETMLVFFFTLTMLFFYTWIRTEKKKALLLTGLALGVGFLAKYQVLVAGLVMIIGLLVFFRGKLRVKRKFLLIPAIALAIIIPWLLLLYQYNGLKGFGELLYVISAGGQDRTLYSVRFPIPIFYFIEMTWPFNDIPVHPISLPIFLLGLSGIGLWAYRRKTEDQFFLIWFFAVFGFFTLIPNRQWRYVITLFPVLAISGASLVMSSIGKAEKTWKSVQSSLNKKRIAKIAAGLIVALTITMVAYSVNDAYLMTARDQIHIPIEEATIYAGNHLSQNQSIMVACAVNLYNADMVRFYLSVDGGRQNKVLQYPEYAVDAFTPNFDLNEFIALCKEGNVKYVFLYEYGAIFPYFNTTLTLHDVYLMLYDSGNFTYEASFGANPRMIIILSFEP